MRVLLAFLAILLLSFPASAAMLPGIAATMPTRDDDREECVGAPVYKSAGGTLLTAFFSWQGPNASAAWTDTVATQYGAVLEFPARWSEAGWYTLTVTTKDHAGNESCPVMLRVQAKAPAGPAILRQQ